MKLLARLERRFGRHAIRNLPLIMVLLQVIGYTVQVAAPAVFNWLVFSPQLICRGQVWRLITWVLMPPSQLDIFTVIMLFFYYWIARTLASAWGDFAFNVYILGGILITDIGMMLAYPVFLAIGTPAAQMNILLMSAYVTTYYIQTSILLAFALTYPDMQVLLYFFIPVKMSWMGILYGAFLVYDFWKAGMATPRLVMVLSLLNFILYFLSTRDLRRMSPKEVARRAKFRKATGQGGLFGGTGRAGNGRTANRRAQNAPFGSNRSGRSGSGKSASTARDTVYPRVNPGGTRHRCTVCGRTELDDPNLEFRFCSRCEGSYEYCQEHLFSHKHIINGVPTDTV